MSQKSNSNQPDGESKSPAAVVTGNGAKEVEKSANQPTAASSARSPKHARLNITPEQAIEILQQSVLAARFAGIDVRIVPVYRKEKASQVLILLDGVTIIDGNLALEGKDA